MGQNEFILVPLKSANDIIYLRNKLDYNELKKVIKNKNFTNLDNEAL